MSRLVEWSRALCNRWRGEPAAWQQAAELACLHSVWPCLTGQRLVQLGRCGLPGRVQSPLRDHMVCDHRLDAQAMEVCVHWEHLPFRTHSMDAVLLPRVLSRCAAPGRVLGEVDRVLHPGGHVLVIDNHTGSPMGWMRGGWRTWSARRLAASLQGAGYRLRRLLWCPGPSGASRWWCGVQRIWFWHVSYVGLWQKQGLASCMRRNMPVSKGVIAQGAVGSVSCERRCA